MSEGPPPRGLPGLLSRAGVGLARLPRPLLALLVIAWGAGIWWLSSRPNDPDTETTFLWDWLSNGAHAPAFGLLALWLTALLVRPRGRRVPPLGAAVAAVVVAVVGAYGAVDEIHQSFIPGRDSSAADVLTDLVGALAVLAVVGYLGRGAPTTRGLVRRLFLGLVACFAAALLSTLLD